MSSLPYSFPTEQYINVPNNQTIPNSNCFNGLSVSEPWNAYQNTQKKANNAVYIYTSTMNAYYTSHYANSNGNPIPVVQFKSQQERLAALVGKLSVQCGRF